jgi:PepSY-associated TM helix.
MAFLPRTRWRQLHRWVVPIAAAPLLLTAATGSLYSLLLEQGIDAFWLIQVHSGRFGPLNLQPYYAALLGLLTVVVIVSGAGLLFSRSRPQGQRPLN